MANRLLDLLDQLPGRRVLLVGDVMLDRYLYGNAERLSPEAPVPVLHFQHEEFRLGGAGSVAANLATLGAHVRLLATVGEDEAGRQIGDELKKLAIDPADLCTTPDRPTTCKTRLVGLAQHRHPQQMMRLDIEHTAALDPATTERLHAKFVETLRSWKPDVVCLEDYNKGVLTAGLTPRLIHAARDAGVEVLIDPAAIADFGKYAGATCLKLNRTETEGATGRRLTGPDDWMAAGRALVERLSLHAAVITLDRQGAFLVVREASGGLSGQHLTTRPRLVYDVTGAGDMVLAALALGRAAGASWADATALANLAGGLEVEKFGAVPVTHDELADELLAETHRQRGKRRTDDELLAELRRHRQAGRRIVFTNGCFDLLHLGHVEYFRFAKRQGDVLVVAVNTDASVRRLKGPTRPLVPEDDRVSVLSELESIDYLVTFDDDTPLRLIQAIRPDVLVKGADYTKDRVVGAEVVESYGGRVELAPLVEGRSTTALVSRIVETYSGGAG